MLPLLSTLSPNAAVLILTAGLVLIALELNRPGSILPGSAGVLVTLLAAASLISRHVEPMPAIVAASCIGVLLLGARRWLSWWIIAATTGVLIFSIEELLPAAPGPKVSVWAAATSGLILGEGITILTRIAHRARQNKGLD
jgi:membrane-bound serine protease (ClpP class)